MPLVEEKDTLSSDDDWSEDGWVMMDDSIHSKWVCTVRLDLGYCSSSFFGFLVEISSCASRDSVEIASCFIGPFRVFGQDMKSRSEEPADRHLFIEHTPS